MTYLSNVLASGTLRLHPLPWISCARVQLAPLPYSYFDPDLVR